MTDDMHSYSYYCGRLDAIKRRWDEVRERLESLLATPACCICGASEPCMQESDLKPGDPGTPCTFDPTAQQLYDWNKGLQERLAETEAARDKLLAERDELSRTLTVSIKALRRAATERDAWRNLVLEHNAIHRGMDIIDIPPELERP